MSRRWESFTLDLWLRAGVWGCCWVSKALPRGGFGVGMWEVAMLFVGKG